MLHPLGIDQILDFILEMPPQAEDIGEVAAAVDVEFPADQDFLAVGQRVPESQREMAHRLVFGARRKFPGDQPDPASEANGYPSRHSIEEPQTEAGELTDCPAPDQFDNSHKRGKIMSDRPDFKPRERCRSS